MKKLTRSVALMSALLALGCAPKSSTSQTSADATTVGDGGSTTTAVDGTTAAVDATTLASGVDATTAGGDQRLAAGTTFAFHLQDAPPEGVTSVKVTVLSVDAHVIDRSTDDADTTIGSDTTVWSDTTAPSDTTTAAETTTAADTTTVSDTTTEAPPAPPAGVDTTTGEDVLLDPAEDGAWLSLPVNKVIDLVAHQGEGAAELLGELALPAGKVTQLRLHLDVSVPENNTMTYGAGVTCNLNTDKVEKTGIKINKVFKAFESKSGSKGDVFLDFDLAESLKEDHSGDCWKLSPVLKLHKVKVDGQEQEL